MSFDPTPWDLACAFGSLKADTRVNGDPDIDPDEDDDEIGPDWSELARWPQDPEADYGEDEDEDEEEEEDEYSDDWGFEEEDEG